MNDIKGRIIWKFGDHFNADLIVGSKYIAERDPEVLGKVCLADYDPEFVSKVRPGDIMIAGRNFGFGHPHQQGLQSLIKVGIACFVAESYYPNWYRMSVSFGFPAIVCPDITKKASVGQELDINFTSGEIKNLTTGETIKGEPYPPYLMEIIEAGGLIQHLIKQLTAAPK
jgi:3-isopropylmalate/(R)-2-methylmalate dehydratase small subunit